MISKKEFRNRLESFEEVEKAIEKLGEAGAQIDVLDSLSQEAVDMFVNYATGATDEVREENRDVFDEFAQDLWEFIVKSPKGEEAEEQMAELYEKCIAIYSDL